MKRFLTTSLTVLAMTMMVDGAYAQTMAAKTPTPGSAEIMPIRNQAEYRGTLIGPGTMSLEASKLATDKAVNPKVKEFAMFETAEQTALGEVLKELNTPKSVMPAEDKMVMDKLQAAKGAEFDRAYMMAQIKGHELLRTITESYLKNASATSNDPMEMEARHLALVSLQTIKQHIVNAKEIAAKL